MAFSRCRLSGLLGLSLLVLLGCKREDQGAGQSGTNMPPGGGPPMPRPALLEETEPHAAGKKVYNANGCMGCHTVGNQGGPPMGKPPFGGGGPPMAGGGPPMGGGGPPFGGPQMPRKGPDLAKVAGKGEKGEKRDVEWFVKYVSNPKKVNPESKMPPFEGKIKEKDMRELAEFLSSLK